MTVRAVVNVAAGDSPAGLILRQKALIERYEAALEEIQLRGETGKHQAQQLAKIAREALGEQVTA